MASNHMHLKILLPSEVFAEKTDVVRLVADTPDGAFGILPRRLDCVAALVPGILVCESASEGEIFVAVDEGVLVKTGREVLVSVRRAQGGTDLRELQTAVEREFVHLNEREQGVRTLLAKMESGLIRQLARFHHD